jgi:plastocyanin
MRAVKTMVAAVAAVALAACGGSSSSSSSRPGAAGFYIQIRGLAFAPLNLRVPAGATVTVLNDDGMAHSVTSQSAPNAFTPGAVDGVSFDTGAFTSGSRTFTIPPGTREGTAIPYYCTTHGSTMATPNGTITVDASAAPVQPPPDPGGGGYGY